ncbi:MAG TPA: hypothetical protein VLY24_19230 [Bryobacteraceae bacterium]|nr:hypothetical protein [Bryobacteraceae bacterium]
MTCHEFWERMPELESEGQPFEHALACPGCAALLEQHQAVEMGLRKAAAESSSAGAPAWLEERLVDAFRANRTTPVATLPTRRWLRRVAPVAVAAAAAVVVAAVLLVWRPLAPVAPSVGPETSASAELDSDFIPLPYAGESGPAEDADLIRVEMSRSALIAMGVPVVDGDGSEPVEAEVVLGMGGAPQAVRVLQ